jgi:hypothetical protein
MRGLLFKLRWLGLRWASFFVLAAVLATDLVMVRCSPFGVGPFAAPLQHAAIGLGTSAQVFEKDGQRRIVMAHSPGWKESIWPTEDSGWVGQVSILVTHETHHGLFTQCVTDVKTGMTLQGKDKRLPISPDLRAEICAQLAVAPRNHGVRWDKLAPFLARGETVWRRYSPGCCLHDLCVGWVACVLAWRTVAALCTSLPATLGLGAWESADV